MAFGVFIHRSDSIYDDTPAERYQFPPQYLSRVRACIGDWIVYYEPRKVPGTRGYFAVAKVEQLIADPSAPGMHLALIEPGSYLDFSNPVPFADGDGAVIERGVLNEAGRISGRAQAAVRGSFRLAPSEIIHLGFKPTDAEQGIARADARLRRLVEHGVDVAGRVVINDWPIWQRGEPA